MKTGLFLTLIFAGINWWAVGHEQPRLERIAKPLTLLALTVSFALATDLAGIALWFVLGLGFSLLGDIFLLLDARYFIAGLVAFLMAHLAYIVGFNQPLPPVNLFSLAMALMLAILAARVFKTIATGLSAHGQEGLRRPVLVYTLVITVMVLSAFNTLFNHAWQPSAALLVSLGATLFFVSDIILAYNRFVRPVKNGRVWNMMAYHLGQMALALGVWLQLM